MAMGGPIYHVRSPRGADCDPEYDDFDSGYMCRGCAAWARGLDHRSMEAVLVLLATMEKAIRCVRGSSAAQLCPMCRHEVETAMAWAKEVIRQ